MVENDRNVDAVVEDEAGIAIVGEDGGEREISSTMGALRHESLKELPSRVLNSPGATDAAMR